MSNAPGWPPGYVPTASEWNLWWGNKLDNTDPILSSVPAPSSTAPAMDGTVAVGTGTTYARADHIHPTDTSRYAASNPSGYQTAAQVTTALAPAFNGIGRNLLHNPLFNVAQRGAGPFTTAAYTLDRWLLLFASDTGVSVNQIALNDTARGQIGDEAATNCLQLTTTGNAAAGAYTEIVQCIEGVRRLAGKTITISFWATGSSSTLKLGLNGFSSYGTGGSPSAAASFAATGTAITLTTAWARYSATFTVPSASGKTFGTTAGSDFTELQIFLSSGATNNAQAGNIGVQSGTVQLWGIQLEAGSVATPLEKPDPRYDLANCQRFYQTVAIYGLITAAGAANFIIAPGTFAVTMRGTPTLTSQVVGSDINAGGYTLDTISSLGFRSYCTSVAAGQANFSRAVTASADL